MKDYSIIVKEVVSSMDENVKKSIGKDTLNEMVSAILNKISGMPKKDDYTIYYNALLKDFSEEYGQKIADNREAVTVLFLNYILDSITAVVHHHESSVTEERTQ